MLFLREYTSKQLKCMQKVCHLFVKISSKFTTFIVYFEVKVLRTNNFLLVDEYKLKKIHITRKLAFIVLCLWPFRCLLSWLRNLFVAIYNTNTHVLHAPFILSWNLSIILTKMNHILKTLYIMHSWKLQLALQISYPFHMRYRHKITNIFQLAV